MRCPSTARRYLSSPRLPSRQCFVAPVLTPVPLYRPSRLVSLVAAGPSNVFLIPPLGTPPPTIPPPISSSSQESDKQARASRCGSISSPKPKLNKSLPLIVCGGSGQGRRLARFEMGRKPTPQPLMLADPNSTLDHAADGEPTFAETTGQGASPVASRSPVSLRSTPFSSRFAPKRPQPGKSALEPAQDVNHRSQSPRDDSAAPTYHPISSASDSPPVSSLHHASGHHSAAESKKPVKSGFFHFNKSSKGSNQFLIPANQHHHQDSREHLTSSGSDGVTVPRRGGMSKSNQRLPPSNKARLRTAHAGVPDHFRLGHCDPFHSPMLTSFDRFALCA